MQRSSTFAVLIASLLSLSVAGAALAGGYTGPNAQVQVNTVAAALKAADDTPVVLEGHIVKRIQGDLYEFKDATGTINVEIDDDHWPAQAISDTAKVRISGEVDLDLASREVEAEYVELIK